MAISEKQLKTWSHQGAKVQSASTYQTIKKVLDDPISPYHKWCYRIFLQGSYGNDTNIYADSDVDVVMCLTSVYYDDTGRLTKDERDRHKANWLAGGIRFDEFKAQVFSWLRSKFGSGVRAGKKAIFIPGNGSRRDADILVCVKHKTYKYYRSAEDNAFWEGICFWTSNGEKIVNYPQQHLENCTSKNRATSGRFKPNIRVIKNMRNTMIDKGYIKGSLAPSYFLEGMLWNVPARNFTNCFQHTFEDYMFWLRQCEPDYIKCANDMHYLLRDGHSVCWNLVDFKEFYATAMLFWNQP